MVCSPCSQGSMLPDGLADFRLLWGFLLMAHSGSIPLRIALGWLEPPHLEMLWYHMPLPCARAACNNGWSQSWADSKVQFMFQSSLWDWVQATFRWKSFLLSFCLISILLTYSLTDVFWEYSLNKSLGHKSLSQSLYLGNPTWPGSPQADCKIL